MAGSTLLMHSTDASAPFMDGSQLNTLVAFLDATLVNGYGSVAGLGWSNAAVTGAVAGQRVYRMAGGTQNYLRVDDTVGVTGTNEFYGLGAAPTSWATYTQKFGCYSGTPVTGSMVVKPGLGRGVWHIIGNSNAFYLLCEPPGMIDVFDCYFFGDISSILGTNDSGRTLCGTKQSLVSGTSGSGTTIQTTFIGNIIATAFPLWTQITGNGGAGMSGNTSGQFVGSSGAPNLCPDATISSPYWTIAPSASIRYPGAVAFSTLYRPDIMVFMDRTTQVCEFRGNLPGLYGVVGNGFNAKNGTTVTGAANTPYAGKSFIAYNLNMNALKTQTWLFDTGTWDN